MTLIFNLKRSNTKSKRTHKKFPRHKFKDINTIPKNLKEWGYCKHNWNDDDYTYLNGNIKKFLMHNLGKPINKVFSKFLQRCHKLGRFNPKEEFYSWIQKKEEISKWYGGFYLTNGILNYKKPIRYVNPKQLDYQVNQNRFNKLDLHSLIKLLYETHVPQCLGEYRKYNSEYTFYMDYTSPNDGYTDLMLEKFRRRKASIDGVGYGINLDIIETQTGKTKYNYSIVNDWLQSNNPTIYFYYLDK